MSIFSQTDFAIHPNTRILSIVACLAVLIWVLYLVRGKKLKEEYSLLWLFAAATIFLLSLFPGILKMLMVLAGIKSFGSTLLLFGMGFILIIILHYAVKISRLEEDRVRMAQNLALLEHKVAQLSENKEPD